MGHISVNDERTARANASEGTDEGKRASWVYAQYDNHGEDRQRTESRDG
jgi:hypothetical protein